MSGPVKTPTNQWRISQACHVMIVACLMSGAASTALAQAQSERAVEETAISVSIAAGPLDRSLRQYAEVAGLQLVYAPELVSGLRSPGLSGDFFRRDGLERLLAGTGLTYRFVGERTVTLERPAKGSTRTLGPVRVEGASSVAVNGINGSTDATATEGSRSYTTNALSIASKTAQSMKETPQSVSVITQQRLQDQNLTDLTSTLNQATGITLVQGNSSLETSFYSRGFLVKSIQIDGGAPIAAGWAEETTVMGYFPQIDMAQYDHVELLRRAAGQLNGYGEPSGSINLTRKRPLDHRQVSLETEAGSWSSYRVVLDASAPLGFDGKLRGRAVTSWQSNEHFYDLAEDARTLVYGVLEYDITPTTLAGGGISHTRQESVPFSLGLPRYQNGDDLGLPRDTCLCFKWNNHDISTTEVFARVEQRFADDWTVKLNVTRNAQESTQKIGSSSGTVNPVTLTGPILAGSKSDYGVEQLSTELTVAGAFEIFGQTQRFVFGANRGVAEADGLIGYPGLVGSDYVPYPGGPVGNPRIDVFHFDASDLRYVEPPDPLPNRRVFTNRQTQSGLYLNFTLTAFDRWHLVSGVRKSFYEYRYAEQTVCPSLSTACRSVGQVISNYSYRRTGGNFSWPPIVSLVYDVTPAVSAYLGYTDIYQAQATFIDRDSQSLEPLTGANMEAGLKWQARDGALNVSIAGYRIEQENFAQLVENVPALSSPPSTRCCYTTNPDQTRLSRGIDAEVTGSMLPNWQVSGGYTWNKNETKGAAYGSTEGRPLVSRQPRHLLKLWTNYTFQTGGGWLDRFSLGAGVNAQTQSYQAGSSCLSYGAPNPTTGVPACALSAPYDYTQKAYATVSARVGYQLGKQWSLGLNTENLTDVRYYQTMGTNTSGNWYGQPRSFALTVRGSF